MKIKFNSGTLLIICETEEDLRNVTEQLGEEDSGDARMSGPAYGWSVGEWVSDEDGDSPGLRTVYVDVSAARWNNDE